MTRRLFRSKASHDDGGHGGDRPWVYFMIDSFFLVTQFFVLTFHLKVADDLVLPAKLPPGAGNPNVVIELDKYVTTPINIAVLRDSAGAAPSYRINGGERTDMKAVAERLGRVAEGHSPDQFVVRVSYEGPVAFGEVLPIFNACQKLRIHKCGLQLPAERFTN